MSCKWTVHIPPQHYPKNTNFKTHFLKLLIPFQNGFITCINQRMWLVATKNLWICKNWNKILFTSSLILNFYLRKWAVKMQTSNWFLATKNTKSKWCHYMFQSNNELLTCFHEYWIYENTNFEFYLRKWVANELTTTHNTNT